ncbi:hypothetical protein [Lysinibacillus endophyticus]|uniref:hypothetical protein n=1 Tax=Ureibacillus endophyticus TaxID=1978490 RepID=UPI00209E14CB|nr:hypothetical protein [Lysinibacillus endophyticus]MCP1144894.1 hypothetical protein [Lysinibacillus endophyticus]
MFFFNKVEVYTGFSIDELWKVQDILAREGIKYTYKVIDPSLSWVGPGTKRGNFGSFGMDSKNERQYVVSVRKKDAEIAKYLINRVLHS